MTTFRFKAIRARQAPGRDVFVFAADPTEVLSFAAIERVARSADGELKGFQRQDMRGEKEAVYIRDFRKEVTQHSVNVSFIPGKIHFAIQAWIQLEARIPQCVLYTLPPLAHGR